MLLPALGSIKPWPMFEVMLPAAKLNDVFEALDAIYEFWFRLFSGIRPKAPLPLEGSLERF